VSCSIFKINLLPVKQGRRFIFSSKKIYKKYERTGSTDLSTDLTSAIPDHIEIVTTYAHYPQITCELSTKKSTFRLA
jgi:hypothetical protein